LRDKIDRHASNEAGEKYAVMSLRITALHESARQLLLPIAEAG
jgi:hypothetical protein